MNARAEAITASDNGYGPNYEQLHASARNWQLPHHRIQIRRGAEKCLENAGVQKGDTILSIGCGIAATEEGMKRLGFSVTAVDFNLPSLQRGAAVVKNGATLVAAEATTLPFFDDSFTVIFTQDFFEHCLGRQHFLATFAEMERVVAKDGIMIHMITTSEDNGIDTDPTHKLRLTPTQWQSWFKNLGWTPYRPTQEENMYFGRKGIQHSTHHGAFYLKRKP